MSSTSSLNYQELAEKIKLWGKELGFSEVAIADIDLSDQVAPFNKWLENNYHGTMDYMARHGDMRCYPEQLHPGTLKAVVVRLNYLPTHAAFASTLEDKSLAYVSRYALGRDYHKLMRNRLKQLGNQIKQHCETLDCRPFVDSAPILERPLAANAGLGWVGKHSLLINQEQGSWFFLGELLVNLNLPADLPADRPVEEQCGHCVACLKICPTGAIVEPYVVDARRCISYLTIEHEGAIDEELRPLMGNRIYGCDDCQLICPWNKEAALSLENDFQARQNLDQISLIELFSWSEQEFLNNTQGSAIRRIGIERWQRNIAIAMGNADFSEEIVLALKAKLDTCSKMVAEHIEWALKQQANKQNEGSNIDIKINRLNQRLIRSIDKGLCRDAR